MTLLFIFLSALFFFAMILNLAAKPKFTRGMIGVFTFLSAAGGLIFYGMGFSHVLSDPVQIVTRTVFAVSRMYAGVNDLASVSSAPIFQNRIAVTIFWVVHFMAFYAMASATISAIGASALKKLKYWLQRYGSSVIIYGINSDTVEFGRSLVASGTRNITFVGNKLDAADETAINAMGALARSDVSALKPDLKFLKSLGSEKGCPELIVYALDVDENQNRQYARMLLNAMEAQHVDSSRSRLIIRCSDDSVDDGLSATKNRYGFGDVRCFTDVSMTTRMLIQAMPPCDKMTFKADGTAAGDFDAIIIGFGRTGRGVLRELVRNAQFEGSHFRAAVFSPSSENENGFFCSSYPGLMENYDISFHSEDAKSIAFYNYLRSVANTLRYVVICTGNRDRNTEIRTETASFLTSIGCDAAICCCSVKSVSWSVSPDSAIQFRSTYSADAIASDAVDRMAMVLNHSYVNNERVSVKEAWKDCDYFSRESSRASADFARAFLRMTGTEEEQLMSGAWDAMPRELMVNLGKTEHLRWCAFHYTMGFLPMNDETVRRRGEAYKMQLEENGKAVIRITKDLTGREHACLCDWDELDKLAILEEQYTGTRKDYKDMDIRNVLSLPAVLKAAKETDL